MLIRQVPTLNYIIYLDTYLLIRVLYFHQCDESFTEIMLEDFLQFFAWDH